MMSFEFRPNPNFQDDALTALKEAIEKIKCPVHGTGVAVTRQGKQFELRFCCDKLKEKYSAESSKR